jgi:hypothetical protein
MKRQGQVVGPSFSFSTISWEATAHHDSSVFKKNTPFFLGKTHKKCVKTKKPKWSSFVFISYFLLLLLLMVFFGNKKKTHAGNDEYKKKSSIEGRDRQVCL